jgi:hypothetical protein
MLGHAEDDVFLTEHEPRRADKAVELAMAGKHKNASTAEGPPDGTPAVILTHPLDPLPEQASDVRQHDILIQVILQR